MTPPGLASFLVVNITNDVVSNIDFNRPSLFVAMNITNDVVSNICPYGLQRFLWFFGVHITNNVISNNSPTFVTMLFYHFFM